MIPIDLFETEHRFNSEQVGAEAVLLRGFALQYDNMLLAKLDRIEKVSPFRHMTTPGGFTMSIGLTNCGQWGWTSDRRGYKYTSIDPVTGKPWPEMPDEFLLLAQSAASAAGFANFVPDACLINRYAIGTKLSLHQDKDEPDLSAPIVSVSLGIPAVFQFGGFERSAMKINIPVFHGDVIVWGGVDRLRYHGILPIKPNVHSVLGEQRINLTFRRASLA